MSRWFRSRWQTPVVAFLCMIAIPAVAGSGYVARSCDLMDEPYRDAEVVVSLEKGRSVEILKRKGGWLNITVGDATGWARMSKIRRGNMGPKPKTAAGAQGVLGLASGRSGTGNVVASTGVRGLGEEELQEAEFDGRQVEKLESFAVSQQQAKSFAAEVELVSSKIEFLPAAR
ncbi:MAG: SH3 domain-containing protein [Gammaproteobacteria bacterium]|nr:SH3 domain-containing protein [Gammaproteobacteria bacterium]